MKTGHSTCDSMNCPVVNKVDANYGRSSGLNKFEMNRWKHIDRTSAGRPTLLEDEAILFVQNSVGLYDG